MSLQLQPLSLDHAEQVQILAADPAIAASTTLPSPYPPNGARVFIEETLELRAKKERFIFAIMVESKLVGVCGLSECTASSANVGYWIGKPYWGRGYATRAGEKLVAYAFSQRGFSQLHSNCLLDNRASYRVLEKIGFHLTSVEPSTIEKWPDRLLAFFVYRRLMWEVGQGGRFSA